MFASASGVGPRPTWMSVAVSSLAIVEHGVLSRTVCLRGTSGVFATFDIRRAPQGLHCAFDHRHQLSGQGCRGFPDVVRQAGHLLGVLGYVSRLRRQGIQRSAGARQPCSGSGHWKLLQVSRTARGRRPTFSVRPRDIHEGAIRVLGGFACDRNTFTHSQEQRSDRR